MSTSRRARPGPGHVNIDLRLSEPGSIRVTVVRACNDPAVLGLLDEILGVVERHPEAIIGNVAPSPVRSDTPKRRGGPAGMPPERKLEIAKGWYKVQGRTKEAAYARSQGISSSTLRRWVRELRQEGKL